MFSRLAIFIVAGWSLWIEPDARQHPHVHRWKAVDGLIRWDASWFMRLAAEGYSNVQDPNFFPLFPLLGRWTHGLTGLSLPVALLVVSNAFALVALVAVYAIFRELEGDAVAASAVGLLAAWPFSFFQAVAYPESIMMAATAGGVFFALRSRHLSAGLALGLGTLGRYLSLAAWPSLLAAQVRERGWGFRRLVLHRSFLGLLLPPAFLAGYMAWLWVRFGNPFAWLVARVYWGDAAWWGLWTLIFTPQWIARTEQAAPVALYLALSVVPMAGAVLLLTRRRWWVLVPFGLGFMLLLYAIGLAGLGRYTAACWPVFLPLGLLLERYPAL